MKPNKGNKYLNKQIFNFLMIFSLIFSIFLVTARNSRNTFSNGEILDLLESEQYNKLILEIMDEQLTKFKKKIRKEATEKYADLKKKREEEQKAAAAAEQQKAAAAEQQRLMEQHNANLAAIQQQREQPRKKKGGIIGKVLGALAPVAGLVPPLAPLAALAANKVG